MRTPIEAPFASASIAAALAMGAPALAQAPFEYLLDDGSGGFVSGPPSTFSATMIWGNYFDAESGAETLTSIRVSFGFDDPPITKPITLLVFDDPDDDLNPTNAVNILALPATAASTLPDEFIEFPIPATTVSGGFFVAVAADLAAGETFARRDTDSPTNRSWFFFDGGLNLDLSTQGFAGQPGSAWMVRAVGVPTPGAGALALFGVAALARRCRTR